MGRDDTGRPIFVPFTIPGEKIKARLITEKNRFARAELVDLLEPSPDRQQPACPHFGRCGGCHFQHMTYETQLRLKRDVVGDQLQRIGGLKGARVQPVLANPSPWAYRADVSLSPTSEGGLGFWSPQAHQVIPIDTCSIIHPRLLELWQDIDIDLPDLRKLTLRIGDDQALLAALEIDGVEPPDLSTDFPVSVAIVLPDATAASLVGDNYLIQQVNGRDFRVSPGCFFQPSPAAAPLLIDAVLTYAGLTGAESILEVFSGVGMLTAFLAGQAAEVTSIELNPDAVADSAVNLAEFDNISLYEGLAEEVLPWLEISPDLVIVDPPSGGMQPTITQAIAAKQPARLVYVSADLPALARDGRLLTQLGFQLVEVQPVDMTPQTFQIDTVSLWQRQAD